MRSLRSVFPLLFALAACGASHTEAPAPVAPAAAPAREVAPTIDEKYIMAGGTTLTVPAGWRAREASGRLTMTGPEPGLALTVVELPPSVGDERAAAQAAWGERASSAPPLRLAVPAAPHNGWATSHAFDYETPPSEERSVWAEVHRHEGGWVVLLGETKNAPATRRMAGLALVSRSLAAKGFVRESFAKAKANPLDAARVAEITGFLEETAKKAGYPGVAYALVQDGKIIAEGGFGVRELGKPEKVDANTTFLIASNTKPLTTLMLAKLVEAGKFTWESPVVDVMPGFRLGDDATTAALRMKHLVCACTGMPRQDADWLLEFRQSTPASTLAAMAQIHPTTKLGEAYQYSNQLASVAGYIGGHAAVPSAELGKAYDATMQKLVFGPLGMKSTTLDARVALRGNHASPHGRGLRGTMAVARMEVNGAAIPLRPAAGAWSSAHDLAQYLRMELANGMLPNGTRYIDEHVLLDRRAPQIGMGEDTSYGMGLIVETARDLTLVHHGGSMIGFKSDMFFLPEHGVGGVVLVNAEEGVFLLKPFARKVVEVLLEGRNEAAGELAARLEAFESDANKTRAEVAVPPDAAVRTGLAARYHSDVLGNIDLRQRGQDTIFDFGEWHSAVGTRKNVDGSHAVVTIDPGVDGYAFEPTTRDGRPVLLFRDAQKTYVFEATEGGAPKPRANGAN
jgi:CubicO group peptidase (beta-lactamase class C family)